MPQSVFPLLCGIILVLGALCAVLAARLYKQNKKLTYIADTLGEINAGKTDRKILMNTDDVLAEIGFGINEILRTSQNRVIELEQAAQTNRVLMSSLSHDVRTPLTTLIGYLDAVHARIVADAERERYIETARTKAYDMKSYIDTLFEWFKLNANEEVLSLAPCDMAELTRDALQDWIVVFEEKQLAYDIDIPDCYLEARVDKAAYARILNNLVQNVLAHSGASRIGVSLRKAGEELRLEVRDNGVGIAPGDVRHVFERLYKCDKSRTHKSSGIGLNIVQQLVEKMGGRVEARSEQKVETVFTVCLPLTN